MNDLGINSPITWGIILVLFIISLVIKYVYTRRMWRDVRDDELLPRVRDMLAGDMSRRNVNDIRNKLVAEGIDAKRVKKLISASVFSMRRFLIWLVIMILLIVILNTF